MSFKTPRTKCEDDGADRSGYQGRSEIKRGSYAPPMSKSLFTVQHLTGAFPGGIDLYSFIENRQSKWSKAKALGHYETLTTPRTLLESLPPPQEFQELMHMDLCSKF
ncbi:hypothetical protein RF11_02052 [Thelohanellus kitauei]|uniref:Uncharacterized protein n=1 Tax=Thelohanellus kitauei TaxID=669202 RepID=A0A0C2MPY8_THEKT|nr:hypothetical protein RF11_02052 [Thelohanellus kitauei]